jgi:hypothetical protein
VTSQKPSEQEEEYFARLEFEKKRRIIEEEREKLEKGEKRRLKELHFMHCPKCGSKLIEIEYRKVKIDECPICQGFWLDWGELEEVITEKDSFLGGMLRIFK